MPAASPGAVLAIDIGSSRIRVTLLDLDGRALRHGAVPTPVRHSAPDRSELSVERLRELLAEVTRGLEPDAAGVRAIGISGLMSTVFLDAHREPVGPALLWNDTRAAGFAASAGAEEATLSERAALRPLTGEMWGPRLRWLAEHEPRRREAVCTVGSVKDAIVSWLTGELLSDPTTASYSGLLDIATGAWSTAAAAAWGVEAGLLPALAPAASAAGELGPRAAAELGLPPGLPVSVGAPDGSVGALAAGAVAAGLTVDIAGTSDVINHLVDHPLPAAGGPTVLNAFLAPGLWGLGGPTGMTGGAVDWTARLLGFTSVTAALETLGSELDRIGPGAGGVTFRPHLSGSRFPEWASGATGAIAGLRPEHGPAHLLAAALEGAAFTVAAGLDAIRACGESVTELRVGGGPAADNRSLQLRATACGVPVLASLEPEMSTIGAGVLAAVCGGLFEELGEAVQALGPGVVRVEPEPGADAPLTEAFERWRARPTRATARPGGGSDLAAST